MYILSDVIAHFTGYWIAEEGVVSVLSEKKINVRKLKIYHSATVKHVPIQFK
jgi:hypothetical protein